jgi:hypothetical protein
MAGTTCSLRSSKPPAVAGQGDRKVITAGYTPEPGRLGVNGHIHVRGNVQVLDVRSVLPQE